MPAFYTAGKNRSYYISLRYKSGAWKASSLVGAAPSPRQDARRRPFSTTLPSATRSSLFIKIWSSLYSLRYYDMSIANVRNYIITQGTNPLIMIQIGQGLKICMLLQYNSNIGSYPWQRRGVAACFGRDLRDNPGIRLVAFHGPIPAAYCSINRLPPPRPPALEQREVRLI